MAPLRFATAVGVFAGLLLGVLLHGADPISGAPRRSDTVFELTGQFNYWTGFFPNSVLHHTPIAINLSPGNPTASATLSGPRQQITYLLSLDTVGGKEVLDVTIHSQADGGFFAGTEGNDYGFGFSLLIPQLDGWTITTNQCSGILSGEPPSSSTGPEDCSVNVVHHNSGCDLATESMFARRVAGASIELGTSFFVAGHIVTHDKDGNEVCNNISNLRGGSATIHLVITSPGPPHPVTSLALALDRKTIPPTQEQTLHVPSRLELVTATAALDGASGGEAITFMATPIDLGVSGHDHFTTAAGVGGSGFGDFSGLPQSTKTCTIGTTGPQECTVTLQVPRFAGVYKIVAILATDASVQAEQTLDVDIRHLLGGPLELVSPDLAYVLTGAFGAINCDGSEVNSEHSQNHYATPHFSAQLKQIATDFIAQYPGFAIRLNDVSLSRGGVFDVNNDWSSQKHEAHREGANADIAFQANSAPGCQFLTLAQLDDLKQIIFNATGRSPVCEGKSGVVPCGTIEDRYHLNRSLK